MERIKYSCLKEFIVLNTYIRHFKSLKINELSIHIETLGGPPQTTELIKIKQKERDNKNENNKYK